MSMFGDVNMVILMGNVTNDPDLRYTPSGAAVLSFSIATNRRYKSGEEWKDEVTFLNIVVWNNAESLAKRIKKGTKVYIEGRIQVRNWENNEGVKQYKTEINANRVTLIARYEGAGESDAANSGSNSNHAPADIEDDAIDPNDLPF